MKAMLFAIGLLALVTGVLGDGDDHVDYDQWLITFQLNLEQASQTLFLKYFDGVYDGDCMNCQQKFNLVMVKQLLMEVARVPLDTTSKVQILDKLCCPELLHRDEIIRSHVFHETVNVITNPAQASVMETSSHSKQYLHKVFAALRSHFSSVLPFKDAIEEFQSGKASLSEFTLSLSNLVDRYNSDIEERINVLLLNYAIEQFRSGKSSLSEFNLSLSIFVDRYNSDIEGRSSAFLLKVAIEEFQSGNADLHVFTLRLSKLVNKYNSDIEELPLEERQLFQAMLHKAMVFCEDIKLAPETSVKFLHRVAKKLGERDPYQPYVVDSSCLTLEPSSDKYREYIRSIVAEKALKMFKVLLNRVSGYLVESDFDDCPIKYVEEIIDSIQSDDENAADKAYAAEFFIDPSSPVKFILSSSTNAKKYFLELVSKARADNVPFPLKISDALQNLKGNLYALRMKLSSSRVQAQGEIHSQTFFAIDHLALATGVLGDDNDHADYNQWLTKFQLNLEQESETLFLNCFDCVSDDDCKNVQKKFNLVMVEQLLMEVARVPLDTTSKANILRTLCGPELLHRDEIVRGQVFYETVNVITNPAQASVMETSSQSKQYLGNVFRALKSHFSSVLRLKDAIEEFQIRKASLSQFDLSLSNLVDRYNSDIEERSSVLSLKDTIEKFQSRNADLSEFNLSLSQLVEEYYSDIEDRPLEERQLFQAMLHKAMVFCEDIKLAPETSVKFLHRVAKKLGERDPYQPYVVDSSCLTREPSSDKYREYIRSIIAEKALEMFGIRLNTVFGSLVERDFDDCPIKYVKELFDSIQSDDENAAVKAYAAEFFIDPSVPVQLFLLSSTNAKKHYLEMVSKARADNVPFPLEISDENRRSLKEDLYSLRKKLSSRRVQAKGNRHPQK